MSKLPILKEANLASLIYFIRGGKVMLDTDLAKLYKKNNTLLITRTVKKCNKNLLSVFVSGSFLIGPRLVLGTIRLSKQKGASFGASISNISV